MPILRAVLITRQAISPRLAIRIFLNIWRSFFRDLKTTKRRARPRAGPALLSAGSVRWAWRQSPETRLFGNRSQRIRRESHPARHFRGAARAQYGQQDY